jgi:hypothetical protein
LISYQLSWAEELASMALANKELDHEPEQTPTHFIVSPNARIISAD